MALKLQKLDQNLVHEHICERYIELGIHAESLGQDLGIYDKAGAETSVDIEPPLASSKKRSKRKQIPTILDDRYNLSVQQSLTSLHSNRDNNNSTTGYVLWSTTPFFLRWLLYDLEAAPLRTGGFVDDFAISGMLEPSTFILELGGGTAGVMPVVLGNYVGSYICTDQRGLISKMQSNIRDNLLQLNKRRCFSNTLGITPPADEDSNDQLVRLETVPLDWEKFKISEFATAPGSQPQRGCSTAYIVAMDVVYNDYLIDPFLRTLSQLLKFYRSKGITTHCLVGIHLRAQEVVADFLEKAIEKHDLPFSYIQAKSLESSRFSMYFI